MRAMASGRRPWPLAATARKTQRQTRTWEMKMVGITFVRAIGRRSGPPRPRNRGVQRGDLLRGSRAAAWRIFPVRMPPLRSIDVPAEDDNYDDEAENERRRQENIKAMLQGDLQVQRRPLVPKLLQVKQSELNLRKPFKTPLPGAANRSSALVQKLMARRKCVFFFFSLCPLLKPFHRAGPRLAPPPSRGPRSLLARGRGRECAPTAVDLRPSRRPLFGREGKELGCTRTRTVVLVGIAGTCPGEASTCSAWAPRAAAGPRGTRARLPRLRWSRRRCRRPPRTSCQRALSRSSSGSRQRSAATACLLEPPLLVSLTLDWRCRPAAAVCLCCCRCLLLLPEVSAQCRLQKQPHGARSTSLHPFPVLDTKPASIPFLVHNPASIHQAV